MVNISAGWNRYVQSTMLNCKKNNVVTAQNESVVESRRWPPL
jgi:hypothetical protein